MAKITSTPFGKADPKLENGTHDYISDTTVEDASTNSTPPEGKLTYQGRISLKSKAHGSGLGSPVLEDGLPDYDNWPTSENADFENDPFCLTAKTYPVFDSGRSRPSSDWLQTLQEGNKRYALRDTDRNTFRGSGWIDKDKSGDFNPDEKSERLTRPQRIRIRKAASGGDLGNGGHGGQKPKLHQPRTLSYEQGRKNGRSMILQLIFSSEAGVEKFKALTREFSAPEAGVEISNGHWRNFSDSAYGSSKSPLKDQNEINTRRSAHNRNEKTYDHPYQNSEDTYENLLGHREARGCKDCFDLGLVCSLIDKCLSYPCDNCEEDDQDCILITPRKDKRVCEHCKQKRLRCSYIHDDEDGIIAACDSCQAANIICIAGPAKSYRMDDILASIGNKETDTKAAPKTQYPFCTKCRKNKIRISTGPTSHNRICRQCLTEKPPSTPNSSPASDKSTEKPIAPPRPLAKRRAGTARAQVFASNKNLAGQRKGSKKQKKVEKPRVKKIDFNFGFDKEPEKPKFSGSVSGGKVMFITTSFCHPIQFNWIPPPPLPQSLYSAPKSRSDTQASSFPCHFCTNPGPSYGIGGLGSKVVEVIRWDHDYTLGYEELKGGWGGAGEEQTRMCQQCTTERMLICICTEHMIRPIKGLDPRTFDFGSAFQSILDQLLNLRTSDCGGIADMAADVKWCSVCPHPAFFECCVRPPFTKSGLETSPSDDIGCGLLLCEVCASRMTGPRRHNRVPSPRPTRPGMGDSSIRYLSEEPVKAIMTLHEHINAASKDTFHYNDGVRADACFLKADSELMRRQGAGSEDAAGEVGGEEEIVIKDDSEYDEVQDRALKRSKWGMGSPIDLTR